MTEEYHHKHMRDVRLHTGSAVMMSVTMMMFTIVCMSGSGFFCFVNCRNCKGKVQTVFGSVAHSAHGGAPPEDREALNQPEQQVQTGTASSWAWQIHTRTHTHAVTQAWIIGQSVFQSVRCQSFTLTPSRTKRSWPSVLRKDWGGEGEQARLFNQRWLLISR